MKLKAEKYKTGTLSRDRVRSYYIRIQLPRIHTEGFLKNSYLQNLKCSDLLFTNL